MAAARTAPSSAAAHWRVACTLRLRCAVSGQEQQLDPATRGLVRPAPVAPILLHHPLRGTVRADQWQWQCQCAPSRYDVRVRTLLLAYPMNRYMYSPTGTVLLSAVLSTINYQLSGIPVR
eukprot:COSAG02_NODE_929_length_15840_cov_55.918493_3_plen_120_part_00